MTHTHTKIPLACLGHTCSASTSRQQNVWQGRRHSCYCKNTFTERFLCNDLQCFGWGSLSSKASKVYQTALGTSLHHNLHHYRYKKFQFSRLAFENNDHIAAIMILWPFLLNKMCLTKNYRKQDQKHSLSLSSWSLDRICIKTGTVVLVVLQYDVIIQE